MLDLAIQPFRLKLKHRFKKQSNLFHFHAVFGKKIPKIGGYQWRIQDFPEEGAPTYEFVEFSQKLHEIERIWTPQGAARPLRPPLGPPLGMPSSGIGAPPPGKYWIHHCSWKKIFNESRAHWAKIHNILGVCLIQVGFAMI